MLNRHDLLLSCTLGACGLSLALLDTESQAADPQPGVMKAEQLLHRGVSAVPGVGGGPLPWPLPGHFPFLYPYTVEGQYGGLPGHRICFLRSPRCLSVRRLLETHRAWGSGGRGLCPKLRGEESC